MNATEIQEKESVRNYEENNDRLIRVTLTDPKIFDCFFCSKPLTIPIFQSEDGGLACCSCIRVYLDISFERCRAAEQFLDSIRAVCVNQDYGCNERMFISKINEHQQTCHYAPYSFCPISDCNFVAAYGPFYEHFGDKHKISSLQIEYNDVVNVTLEPNEKFVVLQTGKEGSVLFLLTNRSELEANYLSVSCLAPLWEGQCNYELVARSNISTRRLQSLVECIKMTEKPPSSLESLMVPKNFFPHGGLLQLELRVWPVGVSSAHMPDGLRDGKKSICQELQKLKNVCHSESKFGVEIDVVKQESYTNAPISIYLTDPDLLDCPICCEHLFSYVYECKNGHIICHDCSNSRRLKNCPSCRLPIGNDRSKAVERILECLKLSCRNEKYGCKEMKAYKEMVHHKKSCEYEQCSCLFPDCDFVGSYGELCRHIALKHDKSVMRFQFNKAISVTLKTSENYIVLQGEKNDDLFILNNITESHGNLLSLIRFAPSSKEKYHYEIMARHDSGRFIFRHVTECILNQVRYLSSRKNALSISSYFSPEDQLDLKITILPLGAHHIGPFLI